MSGRSEGRVNPLRPYYIPPSIGEPADPISRPGPNPLSQGNATGQYASKARDLFSDIDYKEYISEPSPSAIQTVKELMDESLWKYMSVLMAQPFEVAKTILQVRSQDGLLVGGMTPMEEAKLKRPATIYDESVDSDSENEEISYFSSNVPSTPTPLYPRGQRRVRTPTPESPRAIPQPVIPAGQLVIRKPDSILEVISQLWAKEGTWGVWKASNATFVYTVLQSLLENWSRSLLSALFNVPDLGVRDEVDRLVDMASPYPWASFLVAAGAAVATGLILAPIDLVRTRLVLTSVSRGPRRSAAMLRALPSYLCPPALVLPTALHSLVHPVLALSAPLVLRGRLGGVDRDLSGASFSLARLCSSSVALFVKLPLETVLRRGQASVLGSPAYARAVEPGVGAVGLDAIVPIGRYDGVYGTMRHIVSREGTRSVPSAPPKTGRAGSGSKKGKQPKVAETVFLKGQGMEGLWRGWKVSWWGLVGLWTAGMLGGGGDGEF